MRYLSLGLLLVVALLLPAVALSTPANHAVSPRLPVAQPAGIGDGLLLAVSASGGLRLSPDGGRHWESPAGLPARGSFSSLVADVSAAHQGSAFAANGDVYHTADGGYTWSRLAVPSQWLGPAGITVLAGDPRGGVVYAAGALVLSYDYQRWQVYGRGWPAGAVPTALLAVPGHGLYAAVDDRLYHARDATARWLPIPTSAWAGAPVSALALGPDGETPYVAVRGHGVWYVTARGVSALNNEGLPSGALVYALQGDPLGEDLYAATDRGLFVRHQPGTDAPSNRNTWSPVDAVQQGPIQAPIVALRPLRHGRALLAVGRDGTLYSGRRTGGQRLSWRQAGHIPAATNTFVTSALAGAEWQGAPLPALPAQFASGCLPDGPTTGQAFAICGPFRTFYQKYGKSSVLGFPRGPAFAGEHGLVTQAFEKVRLQWTEHSGPILAPMGRVLAGHQVFRKPTVAAAEAARTVYFPGGYYVDPYFYQFWRAYLYPDGRSIFGPPISQRVLRPSTDGTGQMVQVQYFENVRLEYHPDDPQQPIQLSYLPRPQ